MSSAAPPHTPASDKAHAARASDLLVALAEAAPDERISLGQILDVIGERAFGLVLIVMALPCAVPFLYGVPQVMSLPMIFVAAQVAIGRQTLWLPGNLRERTIARSDLRALAVRSGPWLRRLELIARPRLSMLTSAAAERLFGLVMVIAALSIAMPVPLTNSVPAIGVAVLALGMIERDGLLMLGGAVIAFVWIAFLAIAGTTIVAFLLSFL